MIDALDLFSDVGNHAIGFHRAGILTAAFCEVKPYRRAVLAKNFPGIPIYDDIHNLGRQQTADSRQQTADSRQQTIGIGGPPCQRTTVASAIHGYRTGESLWPEMRRVTTGCEWVVVEQPPGNAEWEAEVIDNLCADGRHVSRIEFAACDIGAPYLRRRVFLVACASLSRLEIAWRSVPSAIETVKRAADARGDWNPDKLGALRVDARSAGEMDRGQMSAIRKERIEALGDSNPPHMAEVIGRAIMAAV